MFKMFIPALALALGGCQAYAFPNISDEAIRKTLPTYCNIGVVAHAAFKAYASRGSVKPELSKAVDGAAEALYLVCADAENATSASVIIRAATASAIIVAALKEARS